MLKVFEEMRGKVRAFYFFTYEEDFRAALIIAKENGFLSGNYAIVSLGSVTINSTFRPEYGQELYEGVLQRELWTPTGPPWDHFVQQVIENFNDSQFEGYHHIKPGDDPNLVPFFAG